MLKSFGSPVSKSELPFCNHHRNLSVGDNLLIGSKSCSTGLLHQINFVLSQMLIFLKSVFFKGLVLHLFLSVSELDASSYRTHVRRPLGFCCAWQ